MKKYIVFDTNNKQHDNYNNINLIVQNLINSYNKRFHTNVIKLLISGYRQSKYNDDYSGQIFNLININTFIQDILKNITDDSNAHFEITIENNIINIYVNDNNSVYAMVVNMVSENNAHKINLQSLLNTSNNKITQNIVYKLTYQNIPTGTKLSKKSIFQYV